MLTITFKKKYKTISFILFLVLFSLTIFSQERNKNFIKYKFNWNKISNNIDKFNWNGGELKKTLTNVNKSNIDISYSITGETSTLSKWPYSKSSYNIPAIGKDADEEESLQFYTNGFKTKDGITITISFSKPVEQVSFDLSHVNKYYNNGDKFIVKAQNTNNNEIFPNFSSSPYASYKTNKYGIIDADDKHVGDKGKIGVNFYSAEKIKSITIQWKDCTNCLSKRDHGFGISGLCFSKEIEPKLDSDNDGISDDEDIDDDNDGILDVFESQLKTIQKSTIKGTPLYTINKNVDYEENITDGINYKGAKFNSTKDELVINFGKKIPANTYIKFNSFASNYGFKVLSITESNASGSKESNESYILQYGYYGCYSKNTYYKIREATQYIKIKMIKNYYGGSIMLDYVEHDTYSELTDIDTDNDGIPNRLDLDSDNDSCSDAVEASVPDILINIENLSNGKIEGQFGENGFSNNLEKNDGTNTNAVFQNTYHYALDNTTNACGIPMITQILKTTKDNAIEITNVHPTAIIPAKAIIISAFSNSNENLKNVLPISTIRNSEILKPGESLVIKNSNALISLLKGLPLVDNALSNTLDKSSVITTSRASGKLTWDSRIDVSQNFDMNTSYVRIDEITTPNKDFTNTEWVAFISNNLNPYRDLALGGPERHPNAPPLTETILANSESNALLGLHRINPTERVNGVWTNGYPDRSRFVIIKENYSESNSPLKARKLKVINNSKLVMYNNLLVVSDSINLVQNNDEIRLSQGSELIQTHKNSSKYYGLGKILIDKKTFVKSIYRYTYLSSPVNSVGKNNYTIADVLKDGTSPLSTNSNIVDINFVPGFNGSTTSPISIADYWIYTFSSGNGSRSNWDQKKSTGIVKETSGFIMKGTGNEQNYTFVGSPKDGSLMTRVGTDDSYLLGNPYPSTLSAKKFIEDNINSITGTLYFWQHAGEEDIESSNIAGHSFSGYIGGYATRNIAMGIAANQVSSNKNQNPNLPSVGDEEYKSPGNYIPAGIGFFISGSKTGGPIVFNNSQREYVNDNANAIENEDKPSLISTVLDIIPIIDFETPDELPIIKLGMNYKNEQNTELHRQIGISFNKNNTFSEENGYDSELFDLNKTDFYWKFENNDIKYSIAGIQEISSNLEVPIEIIMNYNGEIKLQIDEINNINSTIYLKDKETNITYNLSENDAALNLTIGTYSNRFFLTFSSNNSSTPILEDILPENFISIHYNSQEEKIEIQKEGTISIYKIALYKIYGRKIGQWDIKEQKEKYTLNSRRNIRKGFYIVKIVSDKGSINKKIFIKN